MRINTGKGTISLMTLIAIWSISLTVNLPGLAITPTLARLDEIFKHTSQLELQLLTMLPNFFIIPFVLLSGKLSMSRDKVRIVVVALIIYLASGISYLFARDMVSLIVISCALGVGCGLLIPLAAGLLADTFVGKYRMQQLGIKSGISNIALVAATFAVGLLSHGNWHLPFLVYLIPAIPLALSPFLRGVDEVQPLPATVAAPAAAAAAAPAVDPKVKATAKVAAHAALTGVAAKAIKTSTPPQLKEGDSDEFGQIGHVSHGFILSRVWSLIAVYFITCVGGVVVSYYCPFLMQHEGMSDTQVGSLTSLFFMAVFLPGFVLPWIVKGCRQMTLIISAACMAGGILLMVMAHGFIIMCLGAILVGAGYGVFQPLIYDKATQVITDPAKSTLALAFVLTANYLSVSITPFIISGISDIFHAGGSDRFPFIVSAVLMAAFTLCVILWRRKFVFAINRDYYS